MKRRHETEAFETALEYVYSCGVEGDVAEFGCYLGESAEVLAHGMRDMEFKYGDIAKFRGTPHRWLWLFDSFEGFPEAYDPIDKEALHVKTGEWRAGHMKGATPDYLRFVCHRYIDRVISIGGWFKDTVPSLPGIAKDLHDRNPTFPPAVKFAVVNIDCDLYESTYQVLDNLFELKLLSDGATILFDDWYCNRGSPRFGEQAAWRDTTIKHNVQVSDWGPYGYAGRRFMVHE